MDTGMPNQAPFPLLMEDPFPKAFPSPENSMALSTGICLCRSYYIRLSYPVLCSNLRSPTSDSSLPPLLAAVSLLCGSLGPRQPAREKEKFEQATAMAASPARIRLMVAAVMARGSPPLPTELHKDATEAYMAYAMSVLLGRALPDVRDWLKPVHHRNLFAMREPLINKTLQESCWRDFFSRFSLVNGHGNFGSIDVDPPAAMRYTECRLQVDFVPNLDNSQKDSSLLPAKRALASSCTVTKLAVEWIFGNCGIQVGTATNIPPYDLGELVYALSVFIHNPEATLQELLEYMPGPDFPTGGILMANNGILDAYRTGRGIIILRGKTDMEVIDSRTKRAAIIIKEKRSKYPSRKEVNIHLSVPAAIWSDWSCTRC